MEEKTVVHKQAAFRSNVRCEWKKSVRHREVVALYNRERGQKQIYYSIFFFQSTPLLLLRSLFLYLFLFGAQGFRADEGRLFFMAYA